MKNVIALVLIISVGLIACNQQSNKQTEHFNKYLQKAFGETIEEQDTVLYLISGRGCINCSKIAMKYYIENFKNERYGTFIITNEAKNIVDVNLESISYKCDTLNLLKRVDLPLDGIAKMKIRNNQIDTIRSLKASELTENHVHRFFSYGD